MQLRVREIRLWSQQRKPLRDRCHCFHQTLPLPTPAAQHLAPVTFPGPMNPFERRYVPGDARVSTRGFHPTNWQYNDGGKAHFSKTRPLPANRLLWRLVLRRLRVKRRDKAFCCGRHMGLVSNYNILRRDFLPVDSLVCVVVRSDARPLQRNSCK